MSRLLVDHSLFSSAKRFLHLLREVGVRKSCSLLVSVVEDHYLHCFDRKYNVKTSGHIRLSTLTFAPARLADATQYGPVNAWAFRRLLNELRLSPKLHFVDLGCGLGRACVLAAEYGFEKVTGVDLARELCESARENAARWRFRADHPTPINILQMDALDFCDGSDDDVFFMYRPFSKEFLERILEKLAAGAERHKKRVTVIYSERMAHGTSHRDAIKNLPNWELVHEAGSFGQAFFVYESVNIRRKLVTDCSAQPKLGQGEDHLARVHPL
jgi:SAM-dependent methyltransferase